MTVPRQLRLYCGPGSCAHCLTRPLPASLLLVRAGEFVEGEGEVKADGGHDP